MSKGIKIAGIVFLSVFAAAFTANILTEIFKSTLKKYYSVD